MRLATSGQLFTERNGPRLGSVVRGSPAQADLHGHQRNGREGDEYRGGRGPPNPSDPLDRGRRVHARRENCQQTGVVGGVHLVNRNPRLRR
jgi:hypothetical protein